MFYRLALACADSSCQVTFLENFEDTLIQLLDLFKELAQEA